MLNRIVALVAIALAATTPAAAETVEHYVNRQVLGGRYMSPTGGCEVAKQDIMNWQAKEVQECHYEVTDAIGGRHTRSKRGLVFLANPTPERVLVWLKSACGRVRPSNLEGCIRSSVKEIRVASGAQFPVAGIVLEDQNEDGIHEAYIFRNGVTVRVENFPSGGASIIDDNEQFDLALSRKIVGVKRTGGYARISSTTREAFAKFTGRTDIPMNRSDAEAAEQWTRIVGEAYRAALATDENLLISAWLCDQHGWPAPCGR